VNLDANAQAVSIYNQGMLSGWHRNVMTPDYHLLLLLLASHRPIGTILRQSQLLATATCVHAAITSSLLYTYMRMI
jgi:hypothetical protein